MSDIKVVIYNIVHKYVLFIMRVDMLILHFLGLYLMTPYWGTLASRPVLIAKLILVLS